MLTRFEDGGRSVSRFANDSIRFRATSAKMLAVYMACLSGTLLLYEGQEIGMTAGLQLLCWLWLMFDPDTCRTCPPIGH